MTSTRTSTFETYASRLEVARLLSDDDDDAALTSAVRELDDAVAAVEGHGFVATPFVSCPELADSAGIGAAELWVKDETGNVSGSHKARHLFGVALAHHLEALADDTPKASQGTAYAIASCGNAALAAAVVARAVDRPLDVFVPTWANEAVVERITSLGGRVVRCEREPGVAGDPAHHAMLAAIDGGAVPFSCQGTETPTAIDGGRTMAWEMVDALVAHDSAVPARLDRLFIQVGGGALASAVVTGLADSAARGELVRMPAVHAVQPEGNHPLVRAWDTLALEILAHERAGGGRDRLYFLDRLVFAQAASRDGLDNRLRAKIVSETGPMRGERLESLVSGLRSDPHRYMQPWPTEPTSYASGILDDITYDWIDIVEAMLASGGWPLVASEDDFRSAHRLAHDHTTVPVCPTGAAGLGGVLAFVSAFEGSSPVLQGERVAVLFTGRMRPGDPDPTVTSP